MIYGRPIYKIAHDSTDRVGIRTLVISMVWQAVGSNLTDAAIAAQTPGYPPVAAGMYFIGRETMPAPGGLRTLWSFEGVNGDGKSVTFKARGLSNDYGFDGSFSEVSLLKNKQWSQLQDNFGLTVLDGQIQWQPTIQNSAAGSGLAGNSKNDGQPNPLYGEDTYFRMEGTYWYRYVSLSPPNTAGVGFIVGSLPGSPPSIGGGRNWLMAPPKGVHRGPVWDITEVYWLSGEKGWPVQIYTPGGASAGGGNITGASRDNNGAGGGLTTGSLGPGLAPIAIASIEPPVGGGPATSPAAGPTDAGFSGAAIGAIVGAGLGPGGAVLGAIIGNAIPGL